MSFITSPFPPIADYAFLSNCHTGALVAPDGAAALLLLFHWTEIPQTHSGRYCQLPGAGIRNIVCGDFRARRTARNPSFGNCSSAGGNRDGADWPEGQHQRRTARKRPAPWQGAGSLRFVEITLTAA